MTPSERSFLTAVIRFQTLRHAGVPSTDPEFFHLRRFLGSDAPDAYRESDDRRAFRRFPAQVDAQVRCGAHHSRCMITDVGGGGMRLTLDEAMAVTPGTSLLLSVQTQRGAERVDFAVEVRCVGPDGCSLGVEFVGAPLTLRQHPLAPKVDAHAQTQEVRAA
ncbi:MAG: PilZ domain-containing protein [Myxococcota bacterium]